MDASTRQADTTFGFAPWKLRSLMASSVSKMGELPSLFAKRKEPSQTDTDSSEQPEGDLDIFAEDEPDLLPLKKDNVAPKSFFMQAERFFQNTLAMKRDVSLPTVQQDLTNLNSTMRDFMKKIDDSETGELRVLLDNFVAEILNQDNPSLTPAESCTTEKTSSMEETTSTTSTTTSTTATLPEASAEDTGNTVPESNKTDGETQHAEKSEPELKSPSSDLSPDSLKQETDSQNTDKDSQNLSALTKIHTESEEVQPPPDLHSEDELLRKFQAKQGLKVQEFIASTLEQFLLHPFWANVKSQTDRDNLWECIERYILVKISRKTFLANKIADYRFWQLLQTYQFIVPKHLDLKHAIPAHLVQDCSTALTQMNFFKTPRNKLICLANCCVAVFNFLSEHKTGDNKTINADEFLPALTYIVIKANPPNLISNLGFIQDFRQESMLLSSWGYFFTNFNIVIDFINNLNPKHLSTGQEISLELEQEWTLLRESHSDKKGGASLNNETVGITTTTTSAPRSMPPSLSSSVSLIDDTPFPERYKFWYLSADEITPDDIPELLAEYKRLVLVEFLNNKQKE